MRFAIEICSGFVCPISALSVSCDAGITPSFRLELEQTILGHSTREIRSLVLGPADVVFTQLLSG